MSHSPESQPNLSDNSELSTGLTVAELNRDALNTLTSKALEPQVYFGRNLDLSDDDRSQLGLVTSTAKAILAPGYTDQRWKDFQTLVQEGTEKGVLFSMTNHEGTNVPTWCVDGGKNSVIKKIRNDTGKAAIQVPSGVFNLFNWDNTVKSVEAYVITSDEGLRGRSALALGKDLQRLAHLISDDKQQEDS